MSDKARLPGRLTTGRLAVLAILLFVLVDLIAADPIDPYQAPYPTALGSGQVPAGGHCTNVFGID